MSEGAALNTAIWKQYERGVDFNGKLRLAETVAANENFFIGRQWEGVNANGLPTPVFNMLKQIVLHQVATISSDNFTISAMALRAYANSSELETDTQIVNDELKALFEINKIPTLIRTFLRNAAVDGDGCLYTYWDADTESGEPNIRGAIKTEVIENTRVLFGNPNNRDVQAQPYIIVWRRKPVDEVKLEAKDNGASEDEISRITPDDDGNKSLIDGYSDNLCTELVRLRRDRKTKTVWASIVTKGAVIKDEWDLGIRSYPITWICWDYVQDCYHGQSLITGLIPNQQFVNKAYAMSMMSLMMSAFPTRIYDKTRIGKWTNQVGAAIGVNGAVDNVAKILEPAQISPQVNQFIDSAIQNTQSLTGATSAALGNTRPDNTSAIIALQKAAAIPSEITKQNLYQCIEDLGRIYIEFMAEYYGKRKVDAPVDKAKSILPADVVEFAAMPQGTKIQAYFDFARLKGCPMRLRLDVGASSYWSEIASMQTLENLIRNGLIDITDFLERVPDGYIAKRQELLEKYLAKQAAADNIAAIMQQPQEGQAMIETGKEPEIPTGGGYHALQRKVNELGIV